jgi:hypothetical protein
MQPKTINPLVGTWEKTPASPCSKAYPDRLVFQRNGTYLGFRTPGTFTIWDGGEFTIVAHDQVRISTANDAYVTYRFTVAGDTVTFVDPQSCEFTYRHPGKRRIPQTGVGFVPSQQGLYNKKK